MPPLKAALSHLAARWRQRGSKHNIRVNSIAPGMIETPVLSEHLDAATIKALGSAVPIGRVGQCEDVVNYALFLASDKFSFITGTMLPIDGGASNILM